MDLELRYATESEYPSFAELDGASFGFHYNADELADARRDIEPTTTLLALDGDTIVGLSGEMPFELSLPGGAVDVVGLTWVSVEITHRRRGVLRAIVERQLRNCVDRGVPAVILSASEGAIYGRYGFGVATQKRRTVVDRRGARLLSPIVDHGVRRMTTEQARSVLPDRYELWRRITPGAVDRSVDRWILQLRDRDGDRGGRSGLFHLVHDEGYVSYRVRSDWNDGHPRHELWITDYVITSPAAHRGLWQVLLGAELSATIESYNIPVDDPLPWLLRDPRSVRTTDLGDGLWLPPLDVPALLAARTYAVEVDLVLDVADPLLGDGRYRLRGGPDGADCERSHAHEAVALDCGALGALLLGGSRVPTLARAGRVRGDEAALTRLDRAMLSDVAPSQGTQF